MAITLAAVVAGDRAALVEFLVAEEWPFHQASHPTKESISVQLASGWLDEAGTETWWVLDDGVRCGLLRLFDLADGAPLFDLRLRGASRGRGVGTATVRLLTEHIFARYAHTDRIEANTRVDNIAMRRALASSGWVKESHWRNAWGAADGSVYDGVGYGVLRTDWELGITTDVPWVE